MAVPDVRTMQAAIPGLGPNVGERWRNSHTGTIATVIGTQQRHYNWVTIRFDEREQIIACANFLKNFTQL